MIKLKQINKPATHPKTTRCEDWLFNQKELHEPEIGIIIRNLEVMIKDCEKNETE